MDELLQHLQVEQSGCYRVPDSEFLHDGGLRLLRAATRYPVALVASPYCGRLHVEERNFAAFADCLIEIPAARPETAQSRVIQELSQFLRQHPQAVVMLSCPQDMEAGILSQLLPQSGERTWFVSIGHLLDAIQGVLGNMYNPFYRQRRAYYDQQTAEKLQPLLDEGLVWCKNTQACWRIVKHPSFWTGIQWHLDRVRRGEHFTFMRIGEGDITAVGNGSYRDTGWEAAPPDDLLPLVERVLESTFELPDNMCQSLLHAALDPTYRNARQVQLAEQVFDRYDLFRFPTMCHSPFWPLTPGSVCPIREFLEFIEEQEAVLIGPHYWGQFAELLRYKEFIPLPHEGLNAKWREVTDQVDAFLKKQRHSRVVIAAASSVVVPLAWRLHDAYSVPHTFWPIGQFLCSYLKCLGKQFEGPFGNNYNPVMPAGIAQLSNGGA